MTRSLRMLKPKLLELHEIGGVAGATAMFWLGVFALMLQFFFPYVVLQAMGIDTHLLKEHPSTFLVLICGVYALVKGIVPLHQRSREAPGLLLFIFVIPILNIYSAYFTGISGAALYAESYLAPAMLAVMLSTASPHQKRFLGRLLITLCVLNVLVALYESATASNWFPLVIDPDAKLTDTDVDFRANAFYGHPLTASFVTAMAVFMLFSMRLRMIVSGPIFALFLVGLLAFGGRTALGITLIVSTLTAVYLLFRGVIRRDLKLEFVVAIVIAAIATPILIGIVITQTSIADRIMDTLYYDGSAEVRTTQLEIFKHLSLRNWLFGISHDDLNVLKYQIGLGGAETDIENFWILMLLNLGAIGFTVFLVAFGMFLFYLGRYTRNMYGWLLVIVALIIDSGSNSLGAKSADLFFEVGFIMAMAGYTDYVRNAPVTKRTVSDRLAKPGRSASALGGLAAVTTRGLRTLNSRAIEHTR